MHKAHLVRFGGFDLDRRSGELLKAGARIRLQERPLRILEALLEQPGEVVTREELRRRLWSDETFVDFDNGLNSAINRLRQSLGDSAERPRFIETVGRRGYRFIASVGTAAPPPTVSAAGASPLPVRLAVLPFRQLTPDVETEFLLWSLPDAIAASLSGFESLTVRSSIAAARFASDAPDIAAVAAALDVSLVFAGTVMRMGERVRVATQLIEAPHGTLLWTFTAEAALSDLFQVSDALVRRIVESVSLPLTVRDARALTDTVPASGHAYELYLRANGFARDSNTWRQARDLYLESIQADPQFPPTWARLGRVYRLMAKYGDDRHQQLTALAEESLRRALAINPELSLAHYLYAQLELETGRSLEALVRLLGRARERPSDAQLSVALVQACRYLGLLAESRAAHERAIRLDPTVKTSIAYTSFMAGDYARAVTEARANKDPVEGVALLAAGRTDAAIECLQATLRAYGSNETWATYLRMLVALARNDRREGIALAHKCLQLPFRDPEGLFFLVIVLARFSDPAGAVAALRTTVDAGFACAPALQCDPALQSLGAIQGFEDLRSEIEARTRRARAACTSMGGDDLFRLAV